MNISIKIFGTLCAFMLLNVLSCFAQTFTITYPNGGETLYAGNVVSITWTTTGATISQVNLDYSTNNGTSWTAIATSIPNFGTYTWSVPYSLSSQCFMRVSSSGNVAVNDQSNAPFTISIPWIWAIRGGGSSSDFGRSVAVDGGGNSYVIGYFNGTASFGGSSLTSAGAADIFVAKANSSGVWQWAVRCGGANSDFGYGITVDGVGNSYITGSFIGSANFGSTNMTSAGSTDVFIAKLNSFGAWQWAVSAGGGSSDEGHGIALDGSGNCYITGNFSTTAGFGTTNLTSAGSTDIFVAKLNNAGVWQWATAGGGGSTDGGNSIAVDGSGNISIIGTFNGTASFGTATLTSTGSSDIFVAKLNNTGVWQWSVGAGGTGTDEGNGITVDGSGNSYITGNFSGTASFGSTALTSYGLGDIFVAKLNSSGSWQWAAGAGGTGNDYSYSIAVDGNGNSYFTGGFTGTAYFGNTTLSSAGSNDVFVAKINGSGVWQWSVHNGSSSSYDYGEGIAIDVGGNSYITGFFSGTVSFGNSTLTSAGLDDVFLAKIGDNCPAPSVSISGNPNFCAGGNTTLTASGGTSYQWNTGAMASSITVITSGTYSVIGYSPFGCSNTATIGVTANPIPSITLGGTPNFCVGQSTTLTATGGTNYRWNTGSTGASISVNSAGTYLVTGANAAGCSSTASMNVTANPTPIIGINGIPAICAGGNTTLTAIGGTSYQWNTGATTGTITVNSVGIYTVTGANSFGCSNSTSISVTSSTNPTIRISGTPNFCAGGNTTLTASGGVSYLWNGSITTPSITVYSAGTYSVTVFNATGCSSTATIGISAYPKPTAGISGSPSFCSGGSTKLTATGGASYLWSNGATSATIIVNSIGTYSVTAFSIFGCSNSKSITVSIAQNLSPQIAGAKAICAGQITTIDAGTGYDSYLWSNGATSQTIMVNPLATTSYSVSVTSGGCSGSTSMTLTVNPKPIASISGTKPVCQGEKITLNAFGGTSFLWNTGETTQSITMQPTTTSIYSVTVANSSGCNASTQATVVVHAQPTVNIVGIKNYCAGDPPLILDAGAGFDAYYWFTGETSQSISYLPSQSTTLTLTVIKDGCTGISTASISVGTMSKISIAGLTTLCIGNTTILDAGAGFSSYFWSNGATTQTITLTPSAGTTTISVIVQNSNGCSSGASVTITVSTSLKPTISGSLTICTGGTTSLDAGFEFSSYRWSNGATTQTVNVGCGTYTVEVANSLGCTGATTIVVSVTAGLLPVISGVSALCEGASATLDAGKFDEYLWSDGSTSQNLTINPTATTTLSVSVRNFNGCSGSTSFTLQVQPIPKPDIQGNRSICEGESQILTVIGAGIQSYLWNTGATTSDITVNAAGIYFVSITNSNGCVGISSAIVTVNPKPSKPTITQNGNLLSSTPAFSYQWYLDGILIAGATNQTLNFTASGALMVKIFSPTGCSETSNILSVLQGKSVVAVGRGQANPGEIVEISLILRTGNNSIIAGLSSYSAKIRYNKSLLEPVDTGIICTQDGDSCEIVVTGKYMGDSVLRLLHFEALLGDDDSTALTLQFVWTDSPQAQVTKIPGEFVLTGISTAGGKRLYKETGSTMIGFYPNPASDEIVLEFELAERGMTEIYLADVLGRRALTVTNEEWKSGHYLYPLDISILHSGTYWIILRTATQRKFTHIEVLK